VTRELGSALLPAPIAALIDKEFSDAREHWPTALPTPEPAMVGAANKLFRRWVSRLS
jgi:hypothetical protein